MNNLLKNSKFLKWIYFALGILSGVIVVSSLFFMTQYRFVRVNYNVNESDERVYEKSAKLNKADQTYLFDFINDIANRQYEKDNGTQAQAVIDNNEIFKIILEADSSSESGYKMLDKSEYDNGWTIKTTYSIKQSYFKQLDDFRTSLDSFNNLILWYGIVSLIVFAALLILSNHSRRIYYKSNVIGGILLPLVNVVFSIILIVQALSIMSSLSDPTNNALFNVVSAIQNPTVGNVNVYTAASEETNLTQINNIINAFNINSTTVILYVVFFALTAVFNIFLMVVAVMKYKATTRERNEVLEKARLVGEKA
jgi:hypothetical protein